VDVSPPEPGTSNADGGHPGGITAPSQFEDLVQRRVTAHERAAATHEKAAVLHDKAARAYDALELPDDAKRERRLAERQRALAVQAHHQAAHERDDANG
jgi:hypothetical protein